MPNLLVFQHLVTLYLGGLVVRVVSEIECWLLKSVQENRNSRLDLAGDSRLQAARCSTRAKCARRWTVMLAGALQDKTGQLAIRLSRDWFLWLSQVMRPSREPPLFCKTWRFTFSSHFSINTPYTHKWKRASRENFERETLKKNKIDSPTIYTLESLQIPQTLFLSIVKSLRGILLKPCSHHIHHCERAVWCSGKQLGRNQSTLVDATV